MPNRPTDLTWTVDESPAAADVQLLDEGLSEFNQERTGIRDGRLFSILLRDEGEEIAGGIYGWTWGGCCFVDKLWLHARLCGGGVGRRLMAAVEALARERGCRQILLDTHSFQAPGFYRKLGFEPVYEIEGYPAGHAKIGMRKRLRP